MTEPDVSTEDDSGDSAYLSFQKGRDELLVDKAGTLLPYRDSLPKVSQHVAEALSARNVAFLLGSGASSLKRRGLELGIPTMQPMAAAFAGEAAGRRGDTLLTATERKGLQTRFGLDVQKAPYSENLEKLLEVLFSLRLVLEYSTRPSDGSARTFVTGCIDKIKRYVFRACTEGAFDPLIGDTEVLELYKAFYRKVVFRDRSLPRPWIFTTNYDLFNETAMDQIGLSYCNGFSGTVERRFNPSTYRYALAEQIDLSERRWAAVDGFVYLCKLHGSVSWIDDGQGLFPIRELQSASPDGRMMIYPTPTKQASSLGAPYSDLFREFQNRISREQSVLFALGYGFADEHVNNIIYQSLTIPTFRLVIFGSPSASAGIKTLSELNDPRIWIINGKTPSGEPAHYFRSVVTDFLPTQSADRIDAAVEKVIQKLLRPGVEPGGPKSER